MAVLGLKGQKDEGQGGGGDDDGWVSFTISTGKVMVKVILTRKES